MARAGTRVPDRRSAGHCPGVDSSSCGDLPDRFSPGDARAGDWADGTAGLRADGQFRTVETGHGRGRKAVGNLQRPEFWGATGFAGHCRLYGVVPGPDDAETLAL